MRRTFFCLPLIFPTLWAIDCYDSNYPTPDKVETCPRPNMYCYSEYYAVNRSGTLRSYHDRFCVDKKHCLSRNIFGCKTLDRLDHKVQKAFIKYHVRAQESEIVKAEFCCCDSDLCNSQTGPRPICPVFLTVVLLFFII